MDTKGAGHRPAPTLPDPEEASGAAIRDKNFHMKTPEKFQEGLEIFIPSEGGRPSEK
jgi:hypothetical protein